MTASAGSGDRKPRSLVVVHSWHHGSTRRFAEALGRVLGAEVRTPGEVDPESLGEYDLVGFGSGIDSGRHYRPLLDLAEGRRAAPGTGPLSFPPAGPGLPRYSRFLLTG